MSVEMKDKLKIVKINVDENPSISQTYSIRSIPALLLLKMVKK